MKSTVLTKYPNYEIFSDGRVRSIKRGIYLKPDASDTRGYLRVSLCHDGQVERIGVHRLVAMAFVSNPEGRPDVNHIDNDPTNNNADNLEWCTHSENMLHCHVQGRCSNLVASETARLKAEAEREAKLSSLLGSRYISSEVINRKSYVTYSCMYCCETFTNRMDKPAIQRGGICRKCKMKI